MSETGFANMVNDLTQTSGITFRKRISARQYQQWLKQYTWDALRNLRYGQSFCNYFDITDHRLFYERNADRCNNLIQCEYLA